VNPLGTRARVEELARLLDGAVAGPGALTAGYASLATRLRAVAPSLDAVAAPRPEFRAQLRQRLVAVATVQAAAAVDAPYAAPLAPPKALEAAVSWSQSRRAQRRIGVMAGTLAGVIAFIGVGVAASRSLPGAPFYGVKRAAEDVQLRFATGDTARGTKHLQFAETRLREVRALAHGEGALTLGAPTGMPVAGGRALGGSPQSRIEDTLDDFDSETISGRTLLEAAYRKTGKPEPLRVLKTFSSQQQARLTALLPSLPAAVKDDAQDSLDLVTEVGADAGQLLALGTCGGECYPQAVPSVTSEPVPEPGVTASPTRRSDNNGVPACACVKPSTTPQPQPATEPTPAEEPTSGPTEPAASPTATPTPTPTPSHPLPVPLPSVVETLIPTLPPLPTLPPPPELPVPLPSLLPSTLPLPRS
jgi:hypothetical protein